MKSRQNSKSRIKKLKRELNALVRARYSFIWLVSNEENRILTILNEIGQDISRKIYVWDDNQYWLPVQSWIAANEYLEEDIPMLLNADNVIDAFQNNINDIADNDTPYILVFPDFHFHLQDIEYQPEGKTLIRLIKWLYPRIRAGKCSVIFLSNTNEMPSELNDIIHVENIRPPERHELDESLKELINNTGLHETIPSEIKENLISAALGLTLNQAERLFSLAITTEYKNPQNMIDVVVEGKKGIIASSGALEFFAPKDVPQYLEGVERLKDWLRLRKNAYSEEARKFKLPKPKGVFLMGIPGTGKSLTAKYIAGTWKMPLLRFDMGAVYSSLVGQTEETMRHALHTVEAIAPAILWIDEIEKAISFGSGNLDAGVSQRVFGTFLTWMQEHDSNVFVIATANDVSHLPPELMRKGRFDEIFFLDLPNLEERRAIFEVHIERFDRNPYDYDIDKFVKKTKGFTGAEIEQIIIESLYRAFEDKKKGRELEDKDILNSIKETKPLSEIKKDMIDNLRQMVERQEVLSASKRPTLKKQEEKKPELELE